MLHRLVTFLYHRLLPAPAQNALRLWLLLDKADAVPQAIEEFGRERVLVLAPHMDDEVIGCGGTIRKHVLAGSPVTVAFLTDGRAGSLNVYHTVEELAAARRKEARAVASLMGFREPVFLDGPDDALRETDEMVQAVNDLVSSTEPSVVYLPSMMDLQRDHWAASRIFARVLENRPRRDRASVRCRQYEVWTPLAANRVADISGVFEVKRQALQQYASQLGGTDYARVTEALNGYRSLHCQFGRGYAEAFWECTCDEFLALYRKAAQRS